MLFQFPRPYPGECLYSVISRYHERSGNRSDLVTMRQLFGRKKILRNLIFSPEHSSYYKNWFEETQTLNIKKLCEEHTAINYGLPFGMCTETTADLSSGSPENKYWYSKDIVYHGKTLRYCPWCARDQKILYGEPYWQVHPQIEGNDVCPIHGEIYRISSLAMPDINYRFIPASWIIKTTGKDNDVPDDYKKIKARYDTALTISKEAEWLLTYGRNCKAIYGGALAKYIAKVLEKDKKLMIAYVNQCAGDIPDAWLTQPKYTISYILYYLNIPQRIYVFHSLFGSISTVNEIMSGFQSP